MSRDGLRFTAFVEPPSANLVFSTFDRWQFAFWQRDNRHKSQTYVHNPHLSHIEFVTVFLRISSKNWFTSSLEVTRFLLFRPLSDWTFWNLPFRSLKDADNCETIHSHSNDVNCACHAHKVAMCIDQATRDSLETLIAQLHSSKSLIDQLTAIEDSRTSTKPQLNSKREIVRALNLSPS